MNSKINTSDFATKLIDLVNQKYPDWEGFTDPRFENDEVRYKQAAIEKARELLNRSDLNRLIFEKADYEEVIKRIAKVGQSTNLLFLAAPKTGDLSVLAQDNLNKETFSQAFYDLIYGDGLSSERLDRYLKYIKENNLPNKWTFPTYFLCICHPNTDIFVKPRTTQWQLKSSGQSISLTSTPDAETYQKILNLTKELWDELNNYHPRDFIDIQGLLWVASQQSTSAPRLAAPFDKMFSSLDDAEWAFDLLQQTASELGVENESNPLVAVNLHKDGKTILTRLIFGSWLILGFSGNKGRLNNVNIVLQTYQLDLPYEYRGRFKTAEGEPPFTLYTLHIDVFKQNQAYILGLFYEGLPKIKSRFSHWARSNFHDGQNLPTAKSVFDIDYRQSILTEIGSTPENTTKAGEPELANFFTSKTFELLTEIHQNPTRAFYNDHRDEFHVHLEEPLKELFLEVAKGFSSQITNRLETKKYLIARMLKNDFQVGGAYDYLWGAFYPKGSKRTSDAQLALWINKDRLEIGFYIGKYGEEPRLRFEKNCGRYVELLMELLSELRHDTNITFDGNQEQPLLIPTPGSFEEWLRNPRTKDFSIKVVLSRNDLLSMPKDQLIETVLKYFILYYPLVLLSMEDEPIMEIQEFLELGSEEPSNKFDIQSGYSIAEVARDTGFTEEDISHWVNAINRKGQAIFYGPPGTGKTFVANKVAQHLVADQPGFIELVQFHPAYSYEEFMQGIRPKARIEGGLDYPTVPGRFLEFCRDASQTTGTCVLIIDEINRANLARVFGELMYLMEYRNESIPLAGGGQFQIPSNVRIIGTMNTADRSIALVDHALRRRFAFLPLFPNYEVLRKFHTNNHTGFPVDTLISVLRNLNENYIRNPHYEIGISYFLIPNLTNDIEDIWRMEIQPYLDEYFFDQPASAQEFRWEKIQGQLGTNP